MLLGWGPFAGKCTLLKNPKGKDVLELGVIEMSLKFIYLEWG